MISMALQPDRTGSLTALEPGAWPDLLATPALERMTGLVMRTLRVPIGRIVLANASGAPFHAHSGLDAGNGPAECAFCLHTMRQGSPVVVEDALKDARFADYAMDYARVQGAPKIRFYAGMPIRNADGDTVGALCAIDFKARTITQDELDTLGDLADLAGSEIERQAATRLAHHHIDRAASMIQKNEARFRSIFERAGVGIALVAPDGGWIDANETLCAIVGYSRHELQGLTFQHITHPDDLDRDLHLLRQLAAGEIGRYQMDKRYLRKDGKAVWISLSVTKQDGEDQRLDYFVAIVQDIDARKEAEAALAALRRELEQRVEERTLSLRSANRMLSCSMVRQAQSQQALFKREAELSAVIENANDAYVCIDEAGVVTAWNHQASATFGWSAIEAIGCALDQLIIPPQLREAHRKGMQRYLTSRQPTVLNQRLELSAMRRDGSILPIEVRIRALDVAGQTIFSAFLHDITERKRAEEAREREARHDALTGLPNRRALFEMLPQAIARADRHGTVIALLFVDLDGFKAVNDAWGHAAGDTLLCEIGRRLAACLRQTDSVARLGGDEFTVLLEGLSSNAHGEAIAIAEKLLESMRVPVPIGAASVEVSGSIGLAFYLPDTVMSPDLLVKGADMAMYHAKRAGKSRVCLATNA